MTDYQDARPLHANALRIIANAPPDRQAMAYLSGWCWSLATMLADDDPRLIMPYAATLTRLSLGAVGTQRPVFEVTP